MENKINRNETLEQMVKMSKQALLDLYKALNNGKEPFKQACKHDIAVFICNMIDDKTLKF